MNSRIYRSARSAAATVVLVLGVAALAGGAGLRPGGEEHWFLDGSDTAFVYERSPQADPKAWAKLTNTKEMVAALAIPRKDLRAMSTKELLAAVLDYPLLGNFLAYDSPQDGFNAMRQELPALDALLQRPDVATVTAEAYSSANLPAVADSRQFAVIDIEFLETLLSQPEVLLALGFDGRRQLAAALVGQWAAKDDLFEEPVFGKTSAVRALMAGLAFDSAPFALAVKSDPASQEFLRAGAINDVPDSAAQHVLLQELATVYGVDAWGKVGTGNSTSDSISLLMYGTVYTPRGTGVSVTYLQSEPYTQAQLQSFNNWIAQTYPFAVRLRSATGKYNCHSYAWFSTATSNYVWMNSPSAYWNDGSYRLVTSSGYVSTVPSAAPVGAKVYYLSGNHSGIRYSSTRIDSKWGKYGLYRHAPNYTPYSTTTTLQYYTRN